MPYIGNQPYQGVIDSGNILNGSIDTVDLKDGSITGAKLETLAGLTANTYGSASAVPQITVDTKGRITSISTNAVSIPSGSISVTGGDITMSGNTGTAITNATIANLAITTAKIADGAVTSAKLANNITIGGTLTVSGNLTVSGTTTTVNSTTLEVADLNVVLGSGATTAAAANGAGITIGNYANNPTILYGNASDNFTVNRRLDVTGGSLWVESTGFWKVGIDSNWDYGTDFPVFNNVVGTNMVGFNRIQIGDPYTTVASTSKTTGRLVVYGGVGIGGALYVGSHILPGTDNAADLGSFTARWRNIYTADMHFSNEGGQNSVDGTWGNWTLQEGMENIYMLNNRTGRRYKIVLEEV